MKKTFIFFVLSCFFLFGSSSIVLALTINGEGLLDIAPRENSPTLKTDTGTTLLISGDIPARKNLLSEWSIPSIPVENAIISSIQLYYYINSSSYTTHNLEIRELIQNFDNNADWNTYNGTDNWVISGGDYSSVIIDSITPLGSGNWLVFDLYGSGSDNPVDYNWGDSFDLIIMGIDDVSETLYVNSLENGVNPPYLEITYSQVVPEVPQFEMLSPSSTSEVMGQLGGNLGANIDSVWQVVLLALSVPLSFVVVRRIIGLF